MNKQEMTLTVQLHQARESKNGFTIMINGDQCIETEGYYVGGFSNELHVRPFEMCNTDTIKMLLCMMSLKSSHADIRLGCWYNEDDDIFVFELSKHFPRSFEAMTEAVARRQKAVYGIAEKDCFLTSDFEF